MQQVIYFKGVLKICFLFYELKTTSIAFRQLLYTETYRDNLCTRVVIIGYCHILFYLFFVHKYKCIHQARIRKWEVL